ncbi:hypothetical protein B0H34DRAFT_796112 [Crassisporium funariophilum]|nr:hypothetical protein B0H34DRAFT_796112 [Crassisporium funariophilum]
MQFKLFSALVLVCMTVLVSAAPVPVVTPPLDVESRETIAREHNTEVAREASPDPMCTRWSCF